MTVVVFIRRYGTMKSFITLESICNEILKQIQGEEQPQIEKSLAVMVKTLLREHYMKMKKLLSD